MKNKYLLKQFILLSFMIGYISVTSQEDTSRICSKLTKSVDEFTGKIEFHTEKADFVKVSYNPLGDFVYRDA